MPTALRSFHPWRQSRNSTVCRRSMTSIAGAGRLVGWTSGGGNSRAGSVSTGAVFSGVTGGAVHTTAATTTAGLTIATMKTKAKKIRTARDRRTPAGVARRPSLVGEIFKLRRQLANPPAVVEPADEARVTLVASDVQELLLGDESAKSRQVGVGVVAHDPADDAGELAPLAFGKRFAVAGDRDQERGGRTGDGVGQDLFALGARDDLPPGADDVGDPVSPHAYDVATAANSGAFEVPRPCVHCQAHYSK